MNVQCFIQTLSLRIKVSCPPLSITCTGSASPASQVNGAFVGASQHSRGILVGENLPVIPH